MGRLAVERVTIERDRMVLLVRVAEGASAHLSADEARRLREARPSLSRHTCLNAEGEPFGAILERTSLPHVLEHLIIDFQVEMTAPAPDRSAATFVGTTEWLREREGLARVAVNFTDDLVALAALKAACALMEGMVQ